MKVLFKFAVDKKKMLYFITPYAGNTRWFARRLSDPSFYSELGYLLTEEQLKVYKNFVW